MNIQGVKLYLIAYLELNMLVLGIVILGLLILGDFKKLSEILVEVLDAFGYLFSNGDGILIELTEIDTGLMVKITVCVERGTINAHMLGVVI